MQDDALFKAARSGDLEAVKTLIDAHVDVNSTQEVCTLSFAV